MSDIKCEPEQMIADMVAELEKAASQAEGAIDAKIKCAVQTVKDYFRDRQYALAQADAVSLLSKAAVATSSEIDIGSNCPPSMRLRSIQLETQYGMTMRLPYDGAFPPPGKYRVLLFFLSLPCEPSYEP